MGAVQLSHAIYESRALMSPCRERRALAACVIAADATAGVSCPQWRSTPEPEGASPKTTTVECARVAARIEGYSRAAMGGWRLAIDYSRAVRHSSPSIDGDFVLPGSVPHSSCWRTRRSSTAHRVYRWLAPLGRTQRTLHRARSRLLVAARSLGIRWVSLSRRHQRTGRAHGGRYSGLYCPRDWRSGVPRWLRTMPSIACALAGRSVEVRGEGRQYSHGNFSLGRRPSTR